MAAAAWPGWGCSLRGRSTPRRYTCVTPAPAGYNDVFARRVLGGEPARLVHLWRREQGVVVPKGNPLDIRGIADLDGVRLAWRPPGTGRGCC